MVWCLQGEQACNRRVGATSAEHRGPAFPPGLLAKLCDAVRGLPVEAKLRVLEELGAQRRPFHKHLCRLHHVWRRVLEDRHDHVSRSASGAFCSAGNCAARIFTIDAAS